MCVGGVVDKPVSYHGSMKQKEEGVFFKCARVLRECGYNILGVCSALDVRIREESNYKEILSKSDFSDGENRGTLQCLEIFIY